MRGLAHGAVPLYWHVMTYSRPQIKHDYPLNLSISVSGGKETNKDSPSSGERTGKSPEPNPAERSVRKCGVWFNSYDTLCCSKST